MKTFATIARQMMPYRVLAANLAFQVRLICESLFFGKRDFRVNNVKRRWRLSTQIFYERHFSHANSVGAFVNHEIPACCDNTSNVRERALGEDFHGEAITLAED